MPPGRSVLAPIRVHDQEGNEMAVTLAMPSLITGVLILVLHSAGVGVSGALLYSRLQNVERAQEKSEAEIQKKASHEALLDLEKRIDRKESEVAATLREIQADIKVLLSRLPANR